MREATFAKHVDFINSCRVRNTSARLFPRSEESPYASCFYLFNLYSLGKMKELKDPEGFKNSLLSELEKKREERLSKGMLSLDKPYLQLLCFTLSALSILDSARENTSHPYVLLLKNRVKEVTAENQTDYLTSAGVAQGRGSSGNLAMFQGVFLLYSHLFEQGNTNSLLEWIEFHLRHVNPLGFWGDAPSKSSFELFQNGYHQYEIYHACKLLLKSVSPIQELLKQWEKPLQNAQITTLKCQGVDGHFAPWPGGGGCHDYDATFLLTLPTEWSLKDENRVKINEALSRLAAAVLNEQNSDGGFCESRSVNVSSMHWWNHLFHSLKKLPHKDARFQLRATLGKLNPAKRTIHTHWTNTHRHWEESNLWDTWFRLLTLAKISTFLPKEKSAAFASYRQILFLNFPGIGFQESSLSNHGIKNET